MIDRLRFGERVAVADAIERPEEIAPRLQTADGRLETLSHWQARAAIRKICEIIENRPEIVSRSEGDDGLMNEELIT